jgi:hypothetical protein
MARIESQTQLRALELRYAAVQGALQLAQTVQNDAQEYVKSYLEAVAFAAGVDLGQGDRVTVNWQSGEVEIEAPLMPDFSEMVIANGVAHD